MGSDNYYENLDLRYPEIAVAVENFYTTQESAKFYIPVLMPTVGSTDKINNNHLASNTNILNKERPTISSNASTTGCITIPIRHERMGTWCYNNTPNLVPKGAKFIVLFIGGDIGNPFIVGRY